jgi:hypothetical protein
MSRSVHRSFLALIVIVILAGTICAQTAANNTPLTNAAVLKLVRAGFKEKTIISVINARPAAYDLSPESMIELKRSGVNENIILAMLSRQQGLSADDEAWENDPFFQTRRDKEKGKPTDQNQQEIFGSSGSGKSSTRNRGSGTMDQSVDTQTTGTATVRIIRPPSEGSAPLKLEKTASLTNDSIIELVEAGFSEGTIIRRIEQSPVEFDFSSAKIAELRKHRVGDRIIAAMRMATGEDSSAGKPTPANGNSKPQ